MSTTPAPTAAAADAEAKIKARIITHLNRDHARELAHYLRHYARVPARIAHDRPTLLDLDFTTLRLRTGSSATEYTIPVAPPMKSWGDARTSTVSMAQEARRALGVADVQVTRYTAPRSAVHVGVFALCASVYASFLAMPWIVAGTWFYDDVLAWYPGGGAMFCWMQQMAVVPMLAIHVGEMYYLHTSRLYKYDVVGLTWWMWMASCFVEGFGTFQRIDEMVKEKEAANAKQSH